ncbi:hypothetical protein YC2023_059016 [Brassica napus]
MGFQAALNQVSLEGTPTLSAFEETLRFSKKWFSYLLKRKWFSVRLWQGKWKKNGEQDDIPDLADFGLQVMIDETESY